MHIKFVLVQEVSHNGQYIDFFLTNETPFRA